MASFFVPGGRFRRTLAAMWLGLSLALAAAPATAQPSGAWRFTGDDQAQEVRAVLNSGELNATIAFERDGRRWSIALQYPDGGAPHGAVSLRAVYDADPSRDRPHRVEQLSLHPLTGESAAQPGSTLKLALPQTFILHLQGADRIEVEDGGRTVTIPLQGSAKAIAMIYAALGEARGGGGKTMTQLANNLGSSASSDTASSHDSTHDSEKASAEAKLEATVPTAQPEASSSFPRWPNFNCKLNDEIPVEDFGTCLQDRIAEIDDYMAKTGDRPYSKSYSLSETIRLLDMQDISDQVFFYIWQEYRDLPMFICDDIDIPHDISYNRSSALQFVTDELKCLNNYHIGHANDLRDKYDSARARIPVDYYGNELKDKLDDILSREESRYREFREALEPRYQEHFRTRKAHGLL